MSGIYTTRTNEKKTQIVLFIGPKYICIIPIYKELPEERYRSTMFFFFIYFC